MVRREGRRCERPALLGSSVCRSHGGALPVVREAARRRLEALQDPAITALERALIADARQLDRRGEVVTLGPDHAAQTRAATAILDRTGMGPSHAVDVNVDASVRLAALIAELDGGGG